jgi:F0F1-type ATP synthase membrane subunit a
MRNALAALALLAVLAALITGSIRYGLGRLPGDIVVQRENFSLYFPLATAILVSIALSLAFWLFGR